MLWSDWLAVVSALGLSCSFAFLARRWAAPLGLVDYPDGGRKRHSKPTPLMGGVAIYLALLVSAGLVAFFDRRWFTDDSATPMSILMLLVSGGFFCVLGLVDDRWPMRARQKFAWQIAASLPFAVWGRSIDALEFMGLQVHLGPCGVVFTVFWLVAFANVINLVDGLDGLAGSIGLVVTLTIAALAGMSGQYAVCILSLLVAASLVGFLVHNLPPAKIFMGDSGSLTVGFVIGALSIESWLRQAMGFTLIVPLVLVSVPMFDTFMAILRRKLTGRSVGHADRGHIHHCLLDRGLSRGQSLLALTGLCSLMAIAAVASVFLNSDLLAMGLCTAILALLIAGRIFGHHEVSLLFRRLARFPRYWPISHVATLAEDSVVSDPRASTVTLRFRDAAHSREEVLQKAA